MKKVNSPLISAVVITKNEEKNLVDCLETLAWVDEVIIIDDNSEDRTREIAKNLKLNIYTRALNNDFASQRNYGLSKAEGEWILFVDADEKISMALRNEILEVIKKNPEIQGYYIKRKDVLWGKVITHGELSSMWLLRLGRKDAGLWTGNVHEVWDIHSRVEKLNNSIVHFPHQSVAEFLSEINMYTTIRAKELFTQKKKVSFISIFSYPIGKFIWNYVFKQGFLDGIQGLIFAIIMSFHSFLVRGKLWELLSREELH